METRDLNRLRHDVYAVKVLRDDRLLDPVVDRAVLFLGALEPVAEIASFGDLGLAQERCVDLEQGLEGRDQKGARAAGGIEDPSRGRISRRRRGLTFFESHEELFEAVVSAAGTLQDELADRLPAQVVRDLGTGVVGPEGLLVDVLLEDVAQDVGLISSSFPPGVSSRCQV